MKQKANEFTSDILLPISMTSSGSTAMPVSGTGSGGMALSQHQVKIGYKALSKAVIEGVRVLANEPRNIHTGVKEAILFKVLGATLNRAEGYDLPDLYLLLLTEEETRGARRD